MFDTGALPNGRVAFGASTAIVSEGRLVDRLNSSGRLFDLAAAALALTLVAPLMTILAFIVLVHDGASPIFAQTRIGANGRRFKCYKFRTMVPDAEARLERLLLEDKAAREEWVRDHKLRRDPRITAIGLFLRKSSLDELPQLFNILLGDMSMVGPRPIVASEIVRYGRYFREYCSVRPGLTGLWQVSGRSDVDYRQRVAMDVLYSRTKSVPRDCMLVLLTVPAVLFSRGSY